MEDLEKEIELEGREELTTTDTDLPRERKGEDDQPPLPAEDPDGETARH